MIYMYLPLIYYYFLNSLFVVVVIISNFAFSGKPEVYEYFSQTMTEIFHLQHLKYYKTKKNVQTKCIKYVHRQFCSHCYL